MKINDKIKQYGVLNSLKRLLKITLRKLGFHYESYWYLVYSIDINEINKKMKKYSFTDVKELSINDFEKNGSCAFNAEKKKLIRRRLKSGEYSGYGIFVNSNLVCSSWISTNSINFGSSFKKKIPLEPGQALLEDAFCYPDYRGIGLHFKMVIFRLYQMYKNNKTEAIVIMIKENKPSLHNQLKSGFSIKKELTLIKLFGKEFYFENLL